MKNKLYIGFAGSDTKSIENLKTNFDLIELPLNICYRCPENIIRVTKPIVPDIEWNPDREDRGTVEFVPNLYEVNLQPNDMIIGRRNADLVTVYKKFVLEKKIPIKFKNIELVNNIVKDIEQCIKDYIKSYIKGLNVDIKLFEYRKANNIPLIDSNLNEANKRELHKLRNTYIKERSKESKTIMKSNYTLEYLEICMHDFKEFGLYKVNKEATLTQYYDIIKSFIEQFKKDNISVLVKDLVDYIKSFLKGNIYKEAPILSTVHMMKGGEADTVYIYDYPRFPYKFRDQTNEEIQQEKNLQYVALTRAKKALYLCLLSEDNDINIDKNEECKDNVLKLLKIVK